MACCEHTSCYIYTNQQHIGHLLLYLYLVDIINHNKLTYIVTKDIGELENKLNYLYHKSDKVTFNNILLNNIDYNISNINFKQMSVFLYNSCIFKHYDITQYIDSRRATYLRISLPKKMIDRSRIINYLQRILNALINSHICKDSDYKCKHKYYKHECEVEKMLNTPSGYTRSDDIIYV